MLLCLAKRLGQDNVMTYLGTISTQSLLIEPPNRPISVRIIVGLSLLLTTLGSSYARADEGTAKFFPSEIGAFKQNWYGKHLLAMGENKIWNQPELPGRTTFRFLWLRTFHHPIAIRIEHEGSGKTTVFGKELNGAGGYKPGKPVTERVIDLDNKEYEVFKNKLAAVNFVQLPAEMKKQSGNDGAHWIFESNDSGNYHIVDRWCADGELKGLGVYLLKLAKLLPADSIY